MGLFWKEAQPLNRSCTALQYTTKPVPPTPLPFSTCRTYIRDSHYFKIIVYLWLRHNQSGFPTQKMLATYVYKTSDALSTVNSRRQLVPLSTTHYNIGIGKTMSLLKEWCHEISLIFPYNEIKTLLLFAKIPIPWRGNSVFSLRQNKHAESVKKFTLPKLKGIVSRDFRCLQMILMDSTGVPDVPLKVFFKFTFSYCF